MVRTAHGVRLALCFAWSLRCIAWEDHLLAMLGKADTDVLARLR